MTAFGVAGALADPVLELHDSDGAIIATNDDWMDNTDEDQQSLIDAALDPTNDLESAIIKTLDPGLYTAVVSGNNGGTGVALIELYDLDDAGAAGELANISTRGFVGTEANVMIGGVIVGPGVGLTPPSWCVRSALRWRTSVSPIPCLIRSSNFGMETET